ncbi:hypothetical protein AB1E18_001452 [Capra hircus]
MGVGKVGSGEAAVERARGGRECVRGGAAGPRAWEGGLAARGPAGHAWERKAPPPPSLRRHLHLTLASIHQQTHRIDATLSYRVFAPRVQVK